MSTQDGLRDLGIQAMIGQLGGGKDYEPVGESLQLSKVNRLVVADGAFYEISCAVTENGVSSPAADLLAKLTEGMWEDPEASELPDEYQVSLRRRLLAEIEMLADSGELPRGQSNSLGDGIWEFKVSNLRMSFFDTDGEGRFVPKLGTSFVAWNGRTEYELPDNFDDFLRLGHCFPKVSERTLKNDLEQANKLRSEDISHDR